MSAVDVNFTRRKQMGIIAQQEYEMMAQKSKLEILEDIQQLEWDDIEIGMTIGYGGFSQVFKVQIIKQADGQFDETEYALKCLNANTMAKTKSFKTGSVDLALEANVLSRLSHPNVIKLHAISGKSSRTAYLQSERGYFLVLDLLTDTLRNKIDKYRLQNPKMRKSGLGLKGDARKGSSSAVLERIKSIGVGVAQGMEYLHQQGVVLRDLKPDNVGFDEDGIPKIFDLGFAREVHTLKPKEVAGSLRYMAPEIALGRPTHYASDVYSFGVLLWEMVTLDKPYKHIQDREEFIESVMIGGWRPSSSAMPSSILKKLVKECWNGNPSHRPTFTRVVKVLKVETSLVRSNTGRRSGAIGMPLPRTSTFTDTSGLSRKNSLGKLPSIKKMTNSSMSMLRGLSKGSLRNLTKRSDTVASEEESSSSKNATFNKVPTESKNSVFNTAGGTSITKLHSRLANALLVPTSAESTSRGNLSELNEVGFVAVKECGYHTNRHVGEHIMTLKDSSDSKSMRKFLRSNSNSKNSCPDLTEERETK
jgi:serine/threonine protein kinase